MADHDALSSSTLAGLLDSPNQSLLDVVDNLLDKGVVLDGELVLGLADVDLIYLRLSAVLVAADRILRRKISELEGRCSPCVFISMRSPRGSSTSAT
jgi:Gas vesicle protein